MTLIEIIALIIGIGGTMAVLSTAVTQFLIGLFKAVQSSGIVKRLISALGSGLVTWGVKFLGYASVVSLIALFKPDFTAPEAPDIPIEFGLLHWLGIWIATWASSSGLVDLGLLGKNRKKRSKN